MTKLEQAISFAVTAHAGTKRKGKDRPYILHPLEVLTIVASLTEDEDILCAAVLHDTVEDTGVTLDEIEARFGARVRALVAAESEDKREGQKAEDTWRVRKTETIHHLETAEQEVLLICLGDKLANLREIARDYALLGDKLWQRFNQKDKKQHAWYYGEIARVLANRMEPNLALTEYQQLIEQAFKKEA